MAETARHPSLYFDYQPYPFVPPPELRQGPGRHRVVIVGGGPVGLATALGLAGHGIASVVLNAGAMESDGSRAACISRRSMEILWRFGLGQAFSEIALPWTSGTSYYRDTPIFRLEMSHGPDERHYPMANIQQNLLERLLIRAADASELIDLRWLSPVVAVDPRQDGVRLGVETPEGAYDIEAEYVVAADGARSAVRQLMGLRLSGETHAARYLIADIRLQSASPTERRAWFDSPVNRGSTVLMHRQPRDIWRVDYQLRDEDDPDVELDPDRVRERIRAVLAMAGETGDWEIDWISLYRAHSLCLDDYVHGRVCFAGDAAHLVPIFGVKGLNSGFADADNLAWKLAAIVEGRAGPGLLASYGQERRAATLDIFREAGKSTRFMTPPTRGYQLMRQGVLSLALTESWAGALADPRQSTPFRYADSPLNGWAVAEAAFTAGPAAGASAVSVRLDEGFLHDLFDTRPVALCVTAGNGDRNALEAAAAMVDRPGGLNLLVAGEGPLPPGARRIADRAGAVARAYGAGPGSIYLLRPDWHVAARSKDGVTVKELEAALDRMWGYDVRD